ncbi:MAG TPA: chemotaxis-specific protein-glutamate methyltransferase CheB [Polyangiaceae bacterium]|jgi:two-component system chemotaxis response regulator CheB|nr:chemotaxis-specific protein-glutamate methyltransferase CheB [Polyangiaceae bacterium]
MSEIRVLLVDDSTLARRMMVTALANHPEIEVVGSVPTGGLALMRLEELRPDAVILDVEMPGIDGVETLKLIRAIKPKLPVIMFSALTERGAEVTVRALAAGASDYVCKPSAVEERSAQSVVSGELVPKLLALCGRRSMREIPIRRDERRVVPGPSVDRVEMLVIASSTGGPNALAVLLPLLPPRLRVPVAIVQHMPPVFTRYLAERITAAGPLAAQEAAGGEPLEPGKVWVAPGNYHLELVLRDGDVQTALSQAPPENSCRPAADVLFRSAAKIFGQRVLGVVLTGMGQDGLNGARAIVDAGGKVLVQDEATSVVWGMPKAIEQAGLAEEVLPLEHLAHAIALRCGQFPQLTQGGAAL